MDIRAEGLSVGFPAKGIVPSNYVRALHGKVSPAPWLQVVDMSST